MAQAIADEQRVRVVTADGAQTVRIPDEFRFASEEVFVRRDTTTGAVLLSERSLSTPENRNAAWQALFNEIDAIGAHDFAIERDKSLPRDVTF